MDNVYSIFMFIFSGALLLYAGLMALTKDYLLLPYRVKRAVKPMSKKDRKNHMVRLSKIIALVSVAPALSGAVGFWNVYVALFVLIAATVAAIWLGTKIIPLNPEKKG